MESLVGPPDLKMGYYSQRKQKELLGKIQGLTAEKGNIDSDGKVEKDEMATRVIPAYVVGRSNKVFTQVDDVSPSDVIEVRFSDGKSFLQRVDSVGERKGGETLLMPGSRLNAREKAELAGDRVDVKPAGTVTDDPNATVHQGEARRVGRRNAVMIQGRNVQVGDLVETRTKAGKVTLERVMALFPVADNSAVSMTKTEKAKSGTGNPSSADIDSDGKVEKDEKELIQAKTATSAITLYHGTGRLFEGFPSRGGKDVLQTGYPSFTHDEGLAEFFAGSNKDARVYSVEVPVDKILDLREESKKGKWKELGEKIRAAGRSNEYDAVAIHDIINGDKDGAEFRLIKTPAKSKWQVTRTAESIETYRKFDETVRKIQAGEATTKRERDHAAKMLNDDLKGGNTSQLLIDTLEELEPEGNATKEEIALAKQRRGDELALLSTIMDTSSPSQKGQGSKSIDLDGDGKVEKDETKVASAKAAVNDANTKRLDLNISPSNPDLRDAHGKWLSKSEDLAEAVAEYKDSRGKTKLSTKEKNAVNTAAGVSDKRPSTMRKGGRGRVIR